MNDFYNHEGYPDPTAYEALKQAEKRRRKGNFLIQVILFICREAGFKVTSRITLEDMETGIELR